MESERDAVLRILSELSPAAREILKAVLGLENEYLHRKNPVGIVDAITDSVRRVVK